MILAGDVGGTKTYLGLFDPIGPRPTLIAVETFITLSHAGLPDMIESFYATLERRPRVERAAFGVAGPVINQSAEMTNVPWRVDAAELEEKLGFARARLLNDLEAMAFGVPFLEAKELHVLQTPTERLKGNVAVIAAGTGLGTSILHRVNDRFVPMASEGGHADFAARTDRELAFVSFLRQRYGRAEIEHVLSGPGLVNLAEFTHNERLCQTLVDVGDSTQLPASISTSAMSGTCDRCREALEMFVEAYGAEAGNLALTAVTTGGVYIGGGIAPRILPALEGPTFLDAFNAKGPMQPLLESMPVFVILNPQTGLLGAAVYAASMNK
jgi:glucokinase